MNRLYILLTVMVVIVGAFFTGQEAVAKVLTGTGGNDTLAVVGAEALALSIRGKGG